MWTTMAHYFFSEIFSMFLTSKSIKLHFGMDRTSFFFVEKNRMGLLLQHKAYST